MTEGLFAVTIQDALAPHFRVDFTVVLRLDKQLLSKISKYIFPNNNKNDRIKFFPTMVLVTS